MGHLPDSALVVADESDREVVFTVQLPEELQNFRAGTAIQVAGGFVGEQQSWLFDQGPRDRNALLLATGQFRRQMVAARREPYLLQCGFHHGSSLVSRDVLEQQRQLHIPQSATGRQQMKSLKDHTHRFPAVQRQPTTVERVQSLSQYFEVAA